MVLGRIGKPHGFRGEFVALTDSGQSSALQAASLIFIGPTPEQAVAYPVLETAWMPKGWKVKLQGIDSEARVQELRGQLVYLDRAALPAPDPGEYYIGDLIGCDVREEETGNLVGALEGVETTEQPDRGTFQDRWLVRSAGGTLEVPAVGRFIARVDVEGRVIWLRRLSELK